MKERLAAPLSFRVGVLAVYRSAIRSSTPRAPVRAPSVLSVGLPLPLSMRLISLWWTPKAVAGLVEAQLGDGRRAFSLGLSDDLGVVLVERDPHCHPCAASQASLRSTTA